MRLVVNDEEDVRLHVDYEKWIHGSRLLDLYCSSLSSLMIHAGSWRTKKTYGTVVLPVRLPITGITARFIA
jgi:hypothetical protein